jgi:hypothetical protein
MDPLLHAVIRCCSAEHTEAFSGAGGGGRREMDNTQLAILVVPIMLTQGVQLLVLIFGFIGNQRRLDGIIRTLERMEARL